MASEELAKKLQSRFAAVEDTENRLEPELSPARSAPREPIGGEDCSELSAMLHRRLDINDGAAAPCATRVFNPYTEFKEFSRRQIKDMEAMFRRYDMGKDGFIDLMELKLMMEKLGAPQTHLGLKNMIREVDEDFDGKLSFRETLSDIRSQVAVALPRPADGQLHSLSPGDFVLVKSFRRHRWNHQRWVGPYQILLTTQTAVKVAERATWIHASHCRRVPPPDQHLALSAVPVQRTGLSSCIAPGRNSAE
ncbi:EF-hand domain-containing protein D1 isoform X1 [Oryzias melastigma]|uniref:EF-hand domain-containing protein D1 isoform X1 n=1 Tax=Oryzias melastigma TaxID=30732 RepID=UPI000CF7BB66|nr:EF-hand domain-containing protein D1 isoform X1 [Oryzias melastigma]